MSKLLNILGVYAVGYVLYKYLTYDETRPLSDTTDVSPRTKSLTSLNNITDNRPLSTPLHEEPIKSTDCNIYRKDTAKQGNEYYSCNGPFSSKANMWIYGILSRGGDITMSEDREFLFAYMNYNRIQTYSIADDNIVPRNVTL